MRVSIRSLLMIAVLISTQALFAAPKFPVGPDLDMTPGELCQVADEIRYPEKIKYCERNVDTSTKRKIMADYDSELGYEITKMPRLDFKIDHLIPLCAGGSNTVKNLWPQHKSVYAITDPLEPLVCDLMSKGKLSQEDAIDAVMTVKLDLSRAKEILAQLTKLQKSSSLRR